MSVQINNTGKTTLTPEQQLELQKRLSKAKSRQEAQAIFNAYKKEVGIVDKTAASNSSAPVQQTNNVEKPVTGTVVERTTQAPKGKVASKTTTDFSVPSSIIIERMGIKDDKLKAEFQKFLSEQKNFAVDEDGNINFANTNKASVEKALNTVMDTFAEQHKEHFVDPDADKFVKFTDDSAPEILQKLSKDGAISSEQGADKRYAVKNEEVLRNTLDKKIGETTYESADSRSATVEADLTTTTTRKENILDVPQNLSESKQARKQLRSEAEKAYEDFAANADPELRGAIDLYIAERKYNKQIDKRMADMLEYKTTIGGTKEKKIQRDDADVIQMYINDYANPEDKDKLNGLVDKLQNSQNEDDQKTIMNALKDSNVIGIPDNFDELTPELKKKGALISMAKACGYDAKTLLRLMATSDVMKDRTPEQIAEDDKYFAKEQAEDYVKNQQVRQDVPNTTVHFSKSSRKDALEDGKIHTDIGKKGRTLVKACPEMLCDEIDAAQFKDDEDSGYFKANIDGKTRYFKFSQDKWKTFMGICCDPTRATDAEMKVLFGDDKKARESFLKDLNMTLQEGRSILDMKLPSPYGETGTLKFENIIGNTNNNIGNKELNALRDMVESAGYSVDKNTTAGKRALHVLKNGAIGYAIGFATGGLGSLLSGAVEVAGMTPAELISITKSVTFEDVTLHGETKIENGFGTVDGSLSDTIRVDCEHNISDKKTVAVDCHHNVTSTDYCTDQFGTTSVTHNTPVSGTTYKDVTWNKHISGTQYKDVTLKGPVSGNGNMVGQGHTTGDLTEEVTLQKEHSSAYQDRGQNHAKTANNTGLLGAIGGLAQGAMTAGKIHERGRNIDDIFALTKEVSDTEHSDETLSLNIRQYTTVETRGCQIEVGEDVEALPAVRWQGPGAYNVLYRYEDGTPVSARDFAQAYKDKINGQMSNRNFYLYKDLEINGKKLVPVDNYKEVYKTIPEGIRGTIAGVDVNPKGKKLVKAQGTISA